VAVPSEFAAVLLTVALDHTFATEFPDVASKSRELAEVLDADACGVCHELGHVCQSLTSTCQFLTAFQQLVMLPPCFAIHFSGLDMETVLITQLRRTLESCP